MANDFVIKVARISKKKGNADTCTFPLKGYEYIV